MIFRSPNRAPGESRPPCADACASVVSGVAPGRARSAGSVEFSRTREAPDPACEDTSVQRVVTAELDLDLGSSVDLIFQVTAAQHVPVVSEELTFTQGERVYTPTEIVDQSGSRLHRLTGEAGRLEVRYEATVEGQTDSEPHERPRGDHVPASQPVLPVGRGVPSGPPAVQGTAGPRPHRRGLRVRRHEHHLHARVSARAPTAPSRPS